MLQQGGNGGVGFQMIRSGAVHGQGNRRVFHGAGAGVSNAGGEGLFLDRSDHFGKNFVQGMIILCRQCRCRAFPVDACLVTQFLCQYRRDTGEASVDRLEDRLRLGGKGLPESSLVAGQGIQFILGMGNEIGLAGQDFPDTADCGRYPLDTVDDGIVIVTEDQVTVFAHQLHDQRLVSQIPHFIQMLNIDMHDTLQPRLGNVHDTAVL